LNTKEKLLSKFLILEIYFLLFILSSQLKDDNGSFICIVKLPDRPDEVKGHGKNKKLAKYDACRKAMKSS
jgi:hypothetical protein